MCALCCCWKDSGLRVYLDFWCLGGILVQEKRKTFILGGLGGKLVLLVGLVVSYLA